jgi:hypothetical protein
MLRPLRWRRFLLFSAHAFHLLCSHYIKLTFVPSAWSVDRIYSTDRSGVNIRNTTIPVLIGRIVDEFSRSGCSQKKLTPDRSVDILDRTVIDERLLGSDRRSKARGIVSKSPANQRINRFRTGALNNRQSHTMFAVDVKSD